MKKAVNKIKVRIDTPAVKVEINPKKVAAAVSAKDTKVLT